MYCLNIYPKICHKIILRHHNFCAYARVMHTAPDYADLNACRNSAVFELLYKP